VKSEPPGEKRGDCSSSPQIQNISSLRQGDLQHLLVPKDSKNPTIFPTPDALAKEIVEDLEAALEQFREIAVDLGQTKI
jgi:hypothetical protein